MYSAVGTNGNGVLLSEHLKEQVWPLTPRDLVSLQSERVHIRNFLGTVGNG